MGPTGFAKPPIRILGTRIDRPSYPEIVAFIERRLLERRFTHIVTANALMLLECESNADLHRALEECDLAVPESSGISCAAALKGFGAVDRMPGIDLMRRLCETAAERGWSVFLVGSKPGTAEEAAAALKRQTTELRVAGTFHGFFDSTEEVELIDRLKTTRPDLLFVGLGSPRQEIWIRSRAQSLGTMVAMGVGGSLDVFSGRLKRAPRWIQKGGLEWLFRLIQEPWRLRRIGRLPIFLIKSLLRD